MVQNSATLDRALAYNMYDGMSDALFTNKDVYELFDAIADLMERRVLGKAVVQVREEPPIQKNTSKVASTENKNTPERRGIIAPKRKKIRARSPKIVYNSLI